MNLSTTLAPQSLSTGLKRMSAGLNLCHENSQELFDQRPNLDFIQIHPEHLLQEKGGTYREHLDILRHHYQVILHGFGLSIGSSGPLDKEYLLLIKNLLKEHPEAVFSDHFSWSSLSKHHFHDLIPLIQSDETVQYMVERIDEAQEAIGAPILLENISSYMRYKESEMSEIQFINEITKRSGCFVLLDVNNIWANAMNFGENPWETLSQINADSIKGYHLAGCTEEQKGNGKVYIDYHGESVHDEVWDLYKQCLEKYGAWPTLLEWENNIPPLTRTLQEVEKISDCFKTLKEGTNS